MFITRASRHDRSDIEEFYEAQEWEGNPSKGTAFIARDGGIVGTIRIVEVEPMTLVYDDIVVKKERRGEGIGAQLLRAAMNNKGGTIYLCSHEENLAFYESQGFTRVDFAEVPGAARLYFEEQGDAPHQLDPDHHHYFLRAR